ncbi:uncharacterized protein LOC127751860, partial [Frankliniella occidentalis]|uniref:Uncharacterized protein LOC127751860 n=1 Tax=Frankliniella occidentalis TaxID=133901 RepID=A0A9C6XA89_FRAOC
MATSVLTLAKLPDDVIVMVLQYLPVEYVLACRLVCKRLCDLAFHWDVWRHRSLKDDDYYAGAVLHLAPCLDTLTVTGLVPTLAVTTTSCAVASLELLLDYASATTAVEYALALRNQESLGRLRKLYLDGLEYYSTPGKDVLVRTVAKCSNLESLEVNGDLPLVSHPVVNGPPKPSLTNFRCAVNENSASFVNTILAAHAATLEH